MFVDPHLLATGGLLDVYVSRFGGGDGKIVGLPALPIEFGDHQRPGVTRQPPKIGEHSAEVLAEAGFTGDEIAALTKSRTLICNME
jgi:crotonobetainyl-CoA:carnitine CoA-transferase CaiB-like acyl-CoA transferase